jgi:predicted dehydrogenase
MSVGIAVVGAGHWGPNFIRNFENPPASHVVAVIDRDASRLSQVQSRFPQVAVSQDVRDVWSDSRVDATIIATPTSTHYPLVKAALEAGKHVLVEKPITNNVAHAEELGALAASARRVLMVGHVFLYNAAVQRVRQYVQTGELGRIYYISMLRTNLGPIRMDVNAAWDLASHDISIANYWLGMEPVSASAIGGTWINAGVEDAVFATIRYPYDVLVNLHVSWLNPRKARDITVAGEKRMLTFDDMNLAEPVRLYDRCVSNDRISPGFIDSFASFRASIRDGDITIPRISSGEPLRTECEHFLKCIATGAEPCTGVREGLAVVRALEAIERSIRHSGREEKI